MQGMCDVCLILKKNTLILLILFQQKTDEKKCYAMIASVDKSIDLSPYLNKPKGDSSKYIV